MESKERAVFNEKVNLSNEKTDSSSNDCRTTSLASKIASLTRNLSTHEKKILLLRYFDIEIVKNNSAFLQVFCNKISIPKRNISVYEMLYVKIENERETDISRPQNFLLRIRLTFIRMRPEKGFISLLHAD
ncbi:hypothetical protein V1478_015127 [Vespula squamosa]|uniref:Uncharacterized protein n=1 Tax=Vespula squamosa TaxID=30214 RepID=A0ABD2A482_VESSQ